MIWYLFALRVWHTEAWLESLWLKFWTGHDHNWGWSGTRSEHFYRKLRVLDFHSLVWNIKYVVTNKISLIKTFSSAIRSILSICDKNIQFWHRLILNCGPLRVSAKNFQARQELNYRSELPPWTSAVCGADIWQFPFTEVIEFCQYYHLIKPLLHTNFGIGISVVHYSTKPFW